MTKRAVFVLGVGRSGTSTVAGILRQLGIEWGPEELMMTPQPENPRGFWEFNPLHEINVELLNRFQSNWHFPPCLFDGWERWNGFDDLRALAKARIDSHFQSSIWGFKDPRCCLTLPFWRTVIDNPIDCVIPLRNPLEVACSLLHRDGTSIKRGTELWLYYMAKAWQHARGGRRHFLLYENILQNPSVEVQRLERFLALHQLRPEVHERAVSFVGKDLRHEHASLGDLASHPLVSPLVKAAYAAIRRYAEAIQAGLNESEDRVEDLLSQGERFTPSFRPCSGG